MLTLSYTLTFACDTRKLSRMCEVIVELYHISSKSINPVSRMIFYELKIAVAYPYKKPNHGPMQTPMRFFINQKMAR